MGRLGNTVDGGQIDREPDTGVVNSRSGGYKGGGGELGWGWNGMGGNMSEYFSVFAL